MKKLLIMLFLACLGYTHTMAQSIHSVELNDGKHLNNTKFSDNWYFGVNGGGLFAWGNAATKADFLDRFGATGGLQLGKKVSTAGEVRLQALYGYNKGYYIPLKKSYGFNEISLSLDWLPNFTNIFYGYKEDRRDIVLCACSTKDMISVESAVKNIDANAFSVIVESSEVLGNGFRMLRVAEPEQ